METVRLEIEILPHFGGLTQPAYQTAGSAGFDLCSAQEEPIDLLPGARVLLPTGLKFAVPAGYEMQIRPRSGLAVKYGITLLNTPGTIDSDYRGEVKVIVVNLGNEAFRLERGMRIGQAVLSSYVKAEMVVVASLDETERGSGGFGHTGT